MAGRGSPITDAVGRGAALDFIVTCQQDPATGTAFLGQDPAGIEAELEGLDQSWLRGLRTVQENGSVLAACTVDWDREASLAWIHGPWGAPERVDRHGAALVAAVCQAVPEGIRRFEMCGQVENASMASLASVLGWTATEVNLAMVIPASEAAGWAQPPVRHGEPVLIRPAVPADVGPLEPLHAAEFGEAYATAAQLLSRHHTVVAVDPGGSLLGYAAGRLQDDGQAYVDFTAVVPGARRRGLGRWLVIDLAARLVAAGQPGMVHLTVRESRTAARALYLSLGMRQDAALRGYRGPRVGPQGMM